MRTSSFTTWSTPGEEVPLRTTAPLPEKRRLPQSWPRKFRAAFRGIKLGVRGHSSFCVHFFFTALVIAAAVALRCELWQWCILLGCIGVVLTAELINSAIETLVRGLDEATRSRVWPCLDIAAGAVLTASLFAAVIGGMVFLKQLVQLMELYQWF